VKRVTNGSIHYGQTKPTTGSKHGRKIEVIDSNLIYNDEIAKAKGDE